MTKDWPQAEVRFPNGFVETRVATPVLDESRRVRQSSAGSIPVSSFDQHKATMSAVP